MNTLQELTAATTTRGSKLGPQPHWIKIHTSWGDILLPPSYFQQRVDELFAQIQNVHIISRAFQINFLQAIISQWITKLENSGISGTLRPIPNFYLQLLNIPLPSIHSTLQQQCSQNYWESTLKQRIWKQSEAWGTQTCPLWAMRYCSAVLKYQMPYGLHLAYTFLPDVLHALVLLLCVANFKSIFKSQLIKLLKLIKRLSPLVKFPSSQGSTGALLLLTVDLGASFYWRAKYITQWAFIYESVFLRNHQHTKAREVACGLGLHSLEAYQPLSTTHSKPKSLGIRSSCGKWGPFLLLRSTIKINEIKSI